MITMMDDNNLKKNRSNKRFILVAIDFARQHRSEHFFLVTEILSSQFIGQFIGQRTDQFR